MGRLVSWLDRPLSGWWCFAGWCAATAVFVGVVSLLGGPGAVDTYQSVFSTWAIAHRQLTCAFPPGFRVIAPIYPLLSGGIANIGHIGSSVPFPSSAEYGTHCAHAFTTINEWSLKANAIKQTMDLAYIGWPFLMAGVISLVRAAGRGKRGWEPTSVVIVALIPPVWLCIEGTFHPQDLIAMGFALSALACVLRERWLEAGILVALAVLSQQFAVLVAAPLLVLVPSKRRLTYVTAWIATSLVIAFPFLVTNFHGAVDAIIFGTGNTGGIGGTVLWELRLHGAPLVLLSRILPIALGMIVAVWALRQLGQRALGPVPVVAIVAVSLSFRLIFEQQLFGYYYMALSVALIVLDVIQGRLRASVIAWIATLSMVYLLSSDALDLLRPPWLTFAHNVIPVAVIVLAILLIAHTLQHRGVSTMLAFWSAMIIVALLAWDETDVLGIPPTWFWQLVFVPIGVVLAAGPLLTEVRRHLENAEQTPRGVLPSIP